MRRGRNMLGADWFVCVLKGSAEDAAGTDGNPGEAQ